MRSTSHELDSPVVAIIDLLTGLLLGASLLAAPWMLGSVSQQAIGWLNGACYILGGLWLARLLLVRRLSGRLIPFLAIGIFLLLWHAVSAMNAPAGWTRLSSSWLPSASDAGAGWLEFRKHLALWFMFAAGATWTANTRGIDATRRARWLLGALVMNAVVLGCVCLAQRLSGVEKLLFTYDPPIAGLVFSWGPFYYRGNGAQYFNLVWPAALGLALYGFRKNRWSMWTISAGLAFCFLLVLPPITASRTGLIACGATSLFAVAAFAVHARRPGRILAGGLVVLLVAGCVVALVGRKGFETRSGSFAKIFQTEDGRSRQNRNSREMLEDHPLTGVGPGTYEAAFRTYNFPNAWMGPDIDPARGDIKGYYFDYARAHNDWFRLLVEWGILGFIPIAAALLLTLLNAFRKTAVGAEIRTGLGLAIVSYLISAWADYGLEVHSIFLTLTGYAAVLAGLVSVKAAK